MLLSVVVVVAGCAVWHPRPPSGFVDGTSSHTVNVGGRDRIYRLHKPSGLPASAGLVVVLHGGFGSAEQAERSYGWDKLADSERFVVAYPDGVNRAWNVNGGGCCGKPAREHVDDVAFISAAVADVAKNVSVNASRVYATGMSNGGRMSYTLACDTTLFAAIGPVSGTQLDPCRSPHPTSVMAIHGPADPLDPYGGGGQVILPAVGEAPDGVATGLVWSANVRTLRHTIEARTDPGAEEEIRLVFGRIGELMRAEAPALFGDYEVRDGAWIPGWRKV